MPCIGPACAYFNVRALGSRGRGGSKRFIQRTQLAAWVTLQSRSCKSGRRHTLSPVWNGNAEKYGLGTRHHRCVTARNSCISKGNREEGEFGSLWLLLYAQAAIPKYDEPSEPLSNHAHRPFPHTEVWSDMGTRYWHKLLEAGINYVAFKYAEKELCYRHRLRLNIV